MNIDINRLFIRPVLIPVIAFAISALLIIVIGEALLNLYETGVAEIQRREIWFGTVFALLILAAGAFVVTRPRTGGMLERDVVVGGQPMFAPAPPPVDVAMRSGARGVIADVGEGFAVYARSGQLARVIGIVPGGIEAGRQYRGYIYAEGVRGATPELWIPFEAVLDVYPETRAVFLAVKGDETETFGWNKPPASFNRVKMDTELPKTL
jgi:hypothetical protein